MIGLWYPSFIMVYDYSMTIQSSMAKQQGLHQFTRFQGLLKEGQAKEGPIKSPLCKCHRKLTEINCVQGLQIDPNREVRRGQNVLCQLLCQRHFKELDGVFYRVYH